MNIKGFKKPSTVTQEGALLADAAAEFSTQIVANPFLVGKLFKNVSVSTSPTSFNHGLGRNFTGWITTRSRTNITIYEGTQTNPSVSLVLLASGDGAIDVWVF